MGSESSAGDANGSTGRARRAATHGAEDGVTTAGMLGANDGAAFGANGEATHRTDGAAAWPDLTLGPTEGRVLPAAAADGRAHAATPPRVGLAMAGGVVEGGFYEVGVLCALEEAIDGLALDALDVYVGVSSGSLLCSLLANGVSARTLSRAILSEASPELDLRPEILFGPAWEEYARRVLSLPWLLARTVQRAIAEPTDRSALALLMQLGRAIPAGLFDGRAVERYLATALGHGGRTNDFRALATRLRVVAVALDTSELVAFGGPDTAHVPISKAVQASIALPGLYCPVEIDGRHYIDGVARRTMHASVALREGASLLFCINPIVPVDVSTADASDVRGRSRAPLVRYGLPAVLSQTFRTLVHSRLDTGFAAYRHTYPDADLILIEPAKSDHRLFFSNIFSFSNRRGVAEHAYQSTRRWLLANADRLAPVLARHGLALRLDVLTDDARRLYAERRAVTRVAPPEATARPASQATTTAAAAARPSSGATGGADRALSRLDAALDRLAARLG